MIRATRCNPNPNIYDLKKKLNNKIVPPADDPAVRCCEPLSVQLPPFNPPLPFNTATTFKSFDCLLLHITLPSSPARDFNFSSAEKTPSIVVVVGMLLISNLYGFIFILEFYLYFLCNVICFGSYPLVICGHDLFSYRRIGFSSVIWGNL